MGTGKYYFNVKSGQQMVTINRKSKEAAKRAFIDYKKVGKTCEWLGKWDGKDFTETSPPKVAELV